MDAEEYLRRIEGQLIDLDQTEANDDDFPLEDWGHFIERIRVGHANEARDAADADAAMTAEIARLEDQQRRCEERWDEAMRASAEASAEAGQVAQRRARGENWGQLRAAMERADQAKQRAWDAMCENQDLLQRARQQQELTKKRLRGLEDYRKNLRRYLEASEVPQP